MKDKRNDPDRILKIEWGPIKLMHWWMSARQIIQYCTVQLAWYIIYRFLSTRTGLSIGHQICSIQVSSISLFLLSVLLHRKGAVTRGSMKANHKNYFRGAVLSRQKIGKSGNLDVLRCLLCTHCTWTMSVCEIGVSIENKGPTDDSEKKAWPRLQLTQGWPESWRYLSQNKN